jgi:hypothetical protein
MKTGIDRKAAHIVKLYRMKKEEKKLFDKFLEKINENELVSKLPTLNNENNEKALNICIDYTKHNINEFFSTHVISQKVVSMFAMQLYCRNYSSVYNGVFLGVLDLE